MFVLGVFLSVIILKHLSEGYEYEEIDRLFDELNQEKELFKEFSRYDSN